MRAPAPIVLCVCCDREGRHNGRGLSDACWKRHEAAGTLNNFPPLRAWTTRLARLEAYAGLLASGERDEDMLARRLGCSIRTVQRYAATHRTLTTQNRNAA